MKSLCLLKYRQLTHCCGLFCLHVQLSLMHAHIRMCLHERDALFYMYTQSWKRRWFVLRDTNLHYYTAVKVSI